MLNKMCGKNTDLFHVKADGIYVKRSALRVISNRVSFYSKIILKYAISDPQVTSHVLTFPRTVIISPHCHSNVHYRTPKSIPFTN